MNTGRAWLTMGSDRVVNLLVTWQEASVQLHRKRRVQQAVMTAAGARRPLCNRAGHRLAESNRIRNAS